MVLAKSANRNLSRAARRKVSGFIDAFFYPLKTSHYLELVNPLWSSHTLQARIEAILAETPECVTLVLRPGHSWRRHRAGQHIRVGVSINGQRFVRTYSLSSAPERDDGLITISIKAIAGGKVSTHLVRQAKVGDYLPIGLPQGDFVLPEAHPVRPLFITAGSGITPVMSMLRSLDALNTLPNVAHLHYAQNEVDLIFAADLKRLRQKHSDYKLNLIYTKPRNQAAGEAHFSPTQLSALVPDWVDRDVWVCGPAALLDATQQHWHQVGLASRLHQERFRARLVPLDSGVEGGQVSFSSSHQTAISDGRTPLLVVAENAGLNPVHGCRMGICQGCIAKVHAGTVRDLRTGQITSCEPGQSIQICVTAAAGDVDLDL